MSEQTTQEPTMEEILASIRRIISEDEPSADAEEAPPAPEPEVVAEAAPPAPEPEPVAAEAPPPPPAPAPEPVMVAPQPEPEEDDDALELTQKVETMGDLDVLEPEPAMAAPAPRPTLVSAPAAMAAATAFGALSAAIAMPRSDRTLEDVVRELLQPLLKQWLDDNLPNIVQQAVADEVERISRGRVG